MVIYLAFNSRNIAGTTGRGLVTSILFEKKRREKPECIDIIIYRVWTLISEIPD